MVRLFGREMSREEVAAKVGALSQVAGVRLVILGDGAERGVRALEFRTGTGLRFSVLIDRAMDIGELEYQGQAIGWQSPTGFRHPSLHEYESEGGLGFLRSFSGFMVTCGLDHTLGPSEVPGDNYLHSARETVRHALHGRVTGTPGRLTGYGESWNGDRCTLWAEGVVRQAAVFGENLLLTRRIEADIGSNVIRLVDRVRNSGFYETPHMLFYHLNLGYPLLDEGAQFVAPVQDVVWAAHDGATYREQGVGYRTMAAPRPGFREQVWQHDMAAESSEVVPVALMNERLQLGIEISTRRDQLPCHYEWQSFQAGQYALGIEPSTHHVLGDLFARDRDEMIWLQHGDERSYECVFRVLVGEAELQETRTRIGAICSQPTEEFPKPSGQFRPLTGRSRATSQPLFRP